MRQLIVADSIRTPVGPATGLLIEGGRVIEVGDADGLRSNAEEVRFPGAVVVPGFRDAHIHPLAMAAPGLNIAEATSIDWIRERIVDTPGIVIGTGLDERNLAEQRLPTRSDLDDVDRPVLIYRVCGHVAVANTAALRAAGLDTAASDPPGGAFDRDAHGTPNGILRETAATLIAGHLDTPAATPEDLLDTLRSLVRLGITSIGAVVTSAWSERMDPLIELADDLPLRVHAIVEAPTRTLDHPLLTFGGVKVFADGSLGGRTAALREPYSDDGSTIGVLRLDRDSAITRARVALDGGGVVAVHAIGDRAIDATLETFEALIEEGAPADHLRVEHASITHDEQVRRMADLGVTACVQPAFVPSDAQWLPSRIGTARAAHTYRFATLLAAGIPTCGSSDAPVESPDPFAAMAAARNRSSFHPEESLSAAQAFALFTANGARSLGEAIPLTPGAPADFAVLDRDPLLVSPAELRSTRVIETWVGGRPIFQSSSRPSIPPATTTT